MDLLIGYIAVGIWVNICLIAGVKLNGLDFVSFWEAVISVVVHTLFWPYTVFALAKDAMGGD